MVFYELPISSSMDVGDYTVILDSPNGHVETTVHVFRPSTPRLYLVGDNELVLYGFAPNETVRLFDYVRSPLLEKMRFIGWAQYRVEASGMLSIRVPDPLSPDHMMYYVVGDQSGAVELRGFNAIDGLRPILISPCGEQPSYLERGMNVSVEENTILRSAPGSSFAYLFNVDPGLLVAIDDGPACEEDSTWWFVDVGNGQKGWMPEYSEDYYLLQPFPKDSFSLIVAAVPEVVFNSNTANQVAPEDVFAEVGFFDAPAKFCDRPPYSAPTLFLAPNNGELLTRGRLIVCGWQPNEVLKATVQYPDGRSISQFMVALSDSYTYYGKFEFRPTLDDPPGLYTFTLKGQKESVTATAEFRAPDGPRLYEIDWAHSLLYHFAPQESVRLLCYDYRGKLLAWQDITVDQSGNQPVSVETGNCTFVALGQSSGEVHQIREWTSTVRKTCGGLLSRLKEYIKARVTFNDGIAKPVRALEGYSQEVVASIPEGTIINIMRGPRCADNSIWWPIQTESGVIGWIPEEQNGIYLLEPVQ